MLPLPRWRMYGSTAWLSHSAAPRLTSIRSRRSSGVAATASPWRNVPIVFTRTSGGPASAAILSMRLLAAAGSTASPASRRMPSGSCFSPSSLRSTPTTVYPAAARAFAVARPSSPPAPTTIATRSLMTPPPGRERPRNKTTYRFSFRLWLDLVTPVVTDTAVTRPSCRHRPRGRCPSRRSSHRTRGTARRSPRPPAGRAEQRPADHRAGLGRTRAPPARPAARSRWIAELARVQRHHVAACARTNSTVAAAGSTVTSQPTTDAPARANVRAVARPMLPPVPVITHTFPASRPAISAPCPGSRQGAVGSGPGTQVVRHRCSPSAAARSRACSRVIRSAAMPRIAAG